MIHLATSITFSSVSDMASKITDQLSRKQLFNLIKQIELRVADDDFLRALVKHFNHQLSEEESVQ